MTSEEIRRYLAFYQDLGVKTLYRRPLSTAAPLALSAPLAAFTPQVAVAPPVCEPERPPAEPVALFPELLAPAPALVTPVIENDTLILIREDIGDCRRCTLCEARQKIVFGSGNEQARLLFVGEGPGADEDASGFPFVGKAGQLLTQMINNTAAKEGMVVRRDDMYIANVVKCRPPGNRTPFPEEIEQCFPFLARQLLTIRPKAIVALGATAAKSLLKSKDSLTRMRGNWYSWRDIPVIVTYHPSYLLRVNTPQVKREAWEDLKKALHFVFDEGAAE